MFTFQLCLCKLREVSAKVFVLKKIRQLDLGKQDTAEGIAEAKLLCTLFYSVTSLRDIVFCGFAEGYMCLRFILSYKNGIRLRIRLEVVVTRAISNDKALWQ